MSIPEGGEGSELAHAPWSLGPDAPIGGSVLTHGAEWSSKSGLSADTQLFNQPFVAVKILPVQIVQQAAPFADQA
jgi:hypothetical protein